eukprot:TRINITY_DN363_c0_g2_i1.p1 TRINITY_DN363_c0_g2~~TRINITY_DN363_c0_g2_i1.p1  ORF type:complete len:403 (+),score=81.83 TRINITY_DN363_c0_g2_i1:55-1263(+)
MAFAPAMPRQPVLLPATFVALAVCCALEATFDAIGAASTVDPTAGKALRGAGSNQSFLGISKLPIAIAVAAAIGAGGLFLRGAGGSEKSTGLWDCVKLPIFVCLWYLFNIQYNIQNKKLLNVFDATWAVCWVQLASGIPMAALLWSSGLIALPKLSVSDVKTLAPSGVFFSIGQIATVASLGAGAVSFTHVVKALEPADHAIVGGLLLGQVFHPMVYCSLIPVFAGVAIASASELSFSTFALLTALASNFAFALRNVLAAKTGSVGDMGEGTITRKTNQLCVLTIVATAVLFPFVLVIPGGLCSFRSAWTAALQQTDAATLIYLFVASSFHFFMYQMSSFWVLSLTQPITHSVLNTLKRVVIIVVSIVVFKTPVTMQGAVGTAIAIGGVFLYVHTKNKFAKK